MLIRSLEYGKVVSYVKVLKYFRIVEANFKWQQAQLMVDYAYKQLQEAVKQWTYLADLEVDKLEHDHLLYTHLLEER